MKKLISSKSELSIGIVFLFAILSISNSCKKESEVPGTNEVFIQGMAFNPGTITVTANTTITWTNKDGISHTVTSNTGIFDSGTINANETYSHMFATAGTYPYHCTVHPTMTATVIVN
jgi:plastocyanin